MIILRFSRHVTAESLLKLYFLPCFTVKQYRDKLVEQAKEYRDFEL